MAGKFPLSRSLRSMCGRARRHSGVLMFLGGFLFDAATIGRIDAVSDLLIQLSYLSALTILLIQQQREHDGRWRPGGRAAKAWAYNVEALHFLYGGLLSAYVILYFRSASGLRGVLFLVLLAGLMVLNELPGARRLGHGLRLGLYGFCVASFIIYFIPILIGRVGDGVFLASLIVSSWIVWRVAGWLAVRGPVFRGERLRLFLPAAGLFAVMAALYLLRLIPPVPLSVQFQGIYHSVEKHAGGYTLRYPAPPFWTFWRADSRPFLAREGDSVHYFSRIYAPRRFKHDVVVRWERFDERRNAFTTTDLHPIPLAGGRPDGFRGTMTKSNYRPGEWRVSLETQDGRIIGSIRFRIETDDRGGERTWAKRKM